MNNRLTLLMTSVAVVAVAAVATAQVPTMVAPSKVTLSIAGEDPQAPPPPPPPPPQTPRAARAPEAPVPPGTLKVEQPKVMAPRSFRGQLINLKLEFTITDQIGAAPPVKKTVTMNVADGESGRIRTNADVYRKISPQRTENNTIPLSIDASPEVEGAKIRLRATLDYQLLNEATAPDLQGGKTSISQMVTSILNDGAQTILCQSADPLTDRKVTLEVKATIVR